jgi:hypothetical protein
MVRPMSRVNLPNEVRAEQWTGVAATLLDHLDTLRTGEEEPLPRASMAALARFFQTVLDETNDAAFIAVLTGRLIVEETLRRHEAIEPESAADASDEARTLAKIRELSAILARLRGGSRSAEQAEPLRAFLEDLLKLGREKQRAHPAIGADP